MNYNLSEWALKNKGLVLYLMLLLASWVWCLIPNLHKAKTHLLPLK